MLLCSAAMQYGFRPKHSTEYAALELIDRIINEMDKNEIPIDIFLDLSKAFDTIDHTILLHKLKYYGLEDSTLRLFESYLKNRKQYTEIEESKSEILPLTIGVPQVVCRLVYICIHFCYTLGNHDYFLRNTYLSGKNVVAIFSVWSRGHFQHKMYKNMNITRKKLF